MPDTALVIIDIQNDYFPGGAMELEGADAAGAKARQVHTAFLAALNGFYAKVINLHEL